MFTNFTTKINATGDYTIIPISFKLIKDSPTDINTLLTNTSVTPASKRAMLVSVFGLDTEAAALIAPDPVAPTEDKRLLIDVLGVGGTQALQSILADATLSADQKKAALMIVFGLSDADAAALAGTTTIVATPNK